MKLTPLMRETLERARRDPLRRTHDVEHGRPPWPAAWQTLRALERHGLLAYDERPNRNRDRLEEWTITDAGRQALEPEQRTGREPRDKFLAATPGRLRYKTLPPAPGKKAGRVTVDENGTAEDGDYTTDPGRASRDAGIVLDPPDPRWAADARERHADARDRRDHARQIRARRRAA